MANSVSTPMGLVAASTQKGGNRKRFASSDENIIFNWLVTGDMQAALQPRRSLSTKLANVGDAGTP